MEKTMNPKIMRKITERESLNQDKDYEEKISGNFIT